MTDAAVLCFEHVPVRAVSDWCVLDFEESVCFHLGMYGVGRT